MADTVIKIDNLSKLYQLGSVGTGTLSHDLNRWWAQFRGKEDPYLKVGHTNDRTAKGTEGELVWALKDINFEVKQGEVLGIIGKNGAGKSTLLKILSRVTSPTTGNVKVKGRIASLLEVGTGFHPELTGRENIYMNGTIMGMRKWEIDRKLDEIVDFAGVAKYIDTPVKRYSSGMTVRLGFAIAAHLEPEILVVDEVLAVGDAEFQKKAIGKMQEVSKGQGRTVLFVSHNMAAVKTLCNRLICIANGMQFYDGSVSEGIQEYFQKSTTTPNTEITYGQTENILGNENIRLNHIKVAPIQGSEITIESGIKFVINFQNFKTNTNIDCTLEVSTNDDLVVFHQGTIVSQNRDSKMTDYTVEGYIQPNILNCGIYKMKLIFGENQRYVLFMQSEVLAFEVLNTNQDANFHKMPGIIRPELKWNVYYS